MNFFWINHDFGWSLFGIQQIYSNYFCKKISKVIFFNMEISRTVWRSVRPSPVTRTARIFFLVGKYTEIYFTDRLGCDILSKNEYFPSTLQLEIAIYMEPILILYLHNRIYHTVFWNVPDGGEGVRFKLIRSFQQRTFLLRKCSFLC